MVESIKKKTYYITELIYAIKRKIIKSDVEDNSGVKKYDYKETHENLDRIKKSLEEIENEILNYSKYREVENDDTLEKNIDKLNKIYEEIFNSNKL